MKRVLSFASIICILCVAVLTASAQKNLSVGNPVTETFNTLLTGNVNLTNNVTIPGVYATRTIGNADPNTLDANNGDFVTAGLFNMGTTGALDRALGSKAAPITGTNYFGVRLVNSGATTISSITVQYTGETWRHGTGLAETLTFEYQTGATVTSLTTGTWTSVAALTYTNPNNPPGQGTLDGNAAENRTTISATFTVTILPGTEIMLRWSDIANGGQLDGLAIDDVTVTAIAPSAADAYITGRVTDAYGRAISSAAITVQGFSGTSRTAFTNTFGYYRVAGLESGESYVVIVSARRYSFANQTMLVNLSDSFAGANFVASR